MEKQLKEHIARMEREIASLETADEEHRRAILAYHLAQTGAFQHERLIHLLVTFFFAFLLFAFVICSLVWPLWQLFVIAMILLVTEVFYVRHYFVLENNVQKLYAITRRLHEMQGGDSVPHSST